MRLLFKSLVPAALIIAGTSFGVVNGAWSDSHDPIVERQGHMKTLGKNLKTSFGLLQGSYNGEQAAVHAAAISEAATALVELFPEGSMSDKSEAAPSIWSDREGFDAILVTLQEGAKAMADAEDKAGFGAGAKMVGSTCKACHSKYRVKKN